MAENNEKQETVAERAVRQFNEAKEALHEFLVDPDIRDVLRELEHLVVQHNTTLDAAMRAIKSELRRSDHDKLVIGGLGAQKKYKRYYDAEFLSNALPAEQADLVLEESVVYSVNKDLLEQLSRQGEIDNDIVQAAYHQTEENPANLPGTPKPYVIPLVPVDA